jgi:prepilin-type N-terminal cleavage/methylation domain-containing protein
MKRSNEKGFTIIEVVLVLAIAGLIFLVVFLALPQLQRSRRDTQRKSDLTKVMALLDTFYGNTGQLPFVAADVTVFEDQYIANANLIDPFGDPYLVQGFTDDVAMGHQFYPDVGQIFFKARHLCNDNAGGPGTDQIQHSTAPYVSFAVWTQLETGGVLCLDNR